MSHEIEFTKDGMPCVFVVGEPAWHKLGTVIDAPVTSEEAIKLAGLDWEVTTRPMFAHIEGEDQVLVPDAYATIRTSDRTPLGVVGNRYTPLQNREAFSFFDPIIEGGLAKYESAGSLYNGKRVWMMAKLNGDIQIGTKGDVVEKFVLLSNSHDGTGGVTGLISGVRTVCQNTLTEALAGYSRAKSGGNAFKIRHTQSVKDRVKTAESMLTSVNEVYEKLGEIWNKMLETEMPLEEQESYFKQVVPDNAASKNPHRSMKTRAELLSLAANGQGSEIDGVLGTLWGCFNSVTAYTSHDVGNRKDSTAESRLDSLWYGSRGDLGAKAFDVAVKVMQARAA